MDPVQAGSPPQSNLFTQSSRITVAQTQPFSSLGPGERDGDAVDRLQVALFNIQEHSDLLTPDLLPTPPAGSKWLTELFTRDEFDSQSFGPNTTFSVKAFQTQVGRVQVDGRAGMETLPFLDKIVAFLEVALPGGVLDSPTDL